MLESCSSNSYILNTYVSSFWVFLGEDLASEDPALYLILWTVDERSRSNSSAASFLFSDGLSSGCYFFLRFDSSSRFIDSIADCFWSFLCIFAFAGLYVNAYVVDFFLDWFFW